MSESHADCLPDVLRWLSSQAGFPARRLDARAERMVCVAALAAEEERRSADRFALQRREPGQTAAMKTHVLRRSQVHFKCDNSAKV